ncbi:MAG TPA: DegT/DnrJ/EryC1/StrS family aminotransferase [Solirubrobacterales bacterium]|jgi:dTDP-4-amino-4,6-dideoxygalactose transaminase|nr:DegT/DnrJ/EryC1/StrS family aminotransferase [Solirubrobacterales bacterium]
MKTAAAELAILGGPPSFAEPLHVGRPNVGDREAVLRAIGEAMDERWLSNNGAKLLEFERRLSEQLGGLHCVATCNATLGLQIVLRALGVEGEVVLPALTFVATAHAVAWERLTPVFADVDPGTLCMGPTEAAARIGPETGALLGVHLWGRSADPQGLERLADERGLPLVFDAAHALGCTREGRPLAGFGDAGVLSFHATKVANSFEGGAVVTADAELAERVATMRNFGFVDEDEIVGLGTNAKMSEAAAAMGLASLDSLDEFLAVSRRNYRAYAEAFDGVAGIRLLPLEPEQANCHHVTIAVDPELAGLDRDALRRVLVAENVLARRYFYPGCHRVPPYRDRPVPALPATDAALESCLSLPTGTAVGSEEIAQIGEIVRLAVSFPAEVRRHLGV